MKKQTQTFQRNKTPAGKSKVILLLPSSLLKTAS